MPPAGPRNPQKYDWHSRPAKTSFQGNYKSPIKKKSAF
uniref:Uncharacterized protein n=1 Tax=Anguilla anguilla TaxID=7936 RepID=A0A0E9UUF6_ANGAN